MKGGLRPALHVTAEGCALRKANCLLICSPSDHTAPEGSEVEGRHRARVVGQRLLGYLLESLGMLLERLLEPVLKPLGASQGLFGGLLGPLLGPLRASWGPAGGLGVQLGAEDSKCELELPLLGPSWGHLGPSGAPLGPSWGSLGPSWGSLGGLSGRLGTILGASWAVLDAARTAEANMLKTHVFRRERGNFGHPRRSWGAAWGVLGAS